MVCYNRLVMTILGVGQLFRFKAREAEGLGLLTPAPFLLFCREGSLIDKLEPLIQL